MNTWDDCTAVERHPERVSGIWVFRGTCVPASALFENLKDGATVDEFLEWFPGVTRRQAEAVLEHGAAAASTPHRCQMDEIDRFAEQAKLFQQWATARQVASPEAAREGLVRITRLYAAGLDLSFSLYEKPLNRSESVTITLDERQAVYENCSRLPLRYYSEVFNPLPIPAEEPVIGDLADDVADIYCDVMRGLELYTLNHRAAAGWEWMTSFQSHWGEHATSAIRALHCWIVQNERDCLPSNEASTS